MENKKVILLFSGGIDSTVLLYWLLSRNYEVFPLLINYGQKSYEGEFKAVNKILNALNKQSNLLVLNISDIQFIGSGSLVGEYPQDISSHEEWNASEFFPHRNMLLITLAATYGYKLDTFEIAIGVVGNSYQDTTKNFLAVMTMTLQQSIAQYELIAPFVEQQRQKVIEEAYKLQVPITLTFSCNATGSRHCLLCTSCLEREEAIQLYEKLSQQNSLKE